MEEHRLEELKAELAWTEAELERLSERKRELKAELAAAQEKAEGCICPGCGAPARPGARFCACCGAALDQEKICACCGARLKAASRFCVFCGTVVRE